eukprot:TRINITY_DN2817_c0_g1_i6.p1 TRINITY_DN2817_c0_g1~~TRINITY_DN2817_c0_g1_i6.p1  ORF type:complete len:914 (-),score=376.64 TRINITY_DN2817_c0_g1_i6:43-2784(-)
MIQSQRKHGSISWKFGKMIKSLSGVFDPNNLKNSPTAPQRFVFPNGENEEDNMKYNNRGSLPPPVPPKPFSSRAMTLTSPLEKKTTNSEEDQEEKMKGSTLPPNFTWNPTSSNIISSRQTLRRSKQEPRIILPKGFAKNLGIFVEPEKYNKNIPDNLSVASEPSKRWKREGDDTFNCAPSDPIRSSAPSGLFSSLPTKLSPPSTRSSNLPSQNPKRLSRRLQDFLSLRDSPIEKLDLSGCNLLPLEMIKLGQSLKENKNLTELDLYYNNIGPEGVTNLFEALKKNSTLKILHLSWNNIGDSGAKSIGDYLRVHSRLSELDLSDNSIGLDGIRCIASSLFDNFSLTSLYFSDNQLGTQGSKCIAKLLTVNTTLQLLVIGNNEIGEEGVKCISEGLKGNKTLVSLDLSSNSMGDEGLIHISNCLRFNNTLTWLDVSKNSIGDYGISRFTSCLEENRSLVSLNLSKNMIQNCGGRELLKTISATKNLEEIDLSDNPKISKEILTEIAQISMRNQSESIEGKKKDDEDNEKNEGKIFSVSEKLEYSKEKVKESQKSLDENRKNLENSEKNLEKIKKDQEAIDIEREKCIKNEEDIRKRLEILVAEREKTTEKLEELNQKFKKNSEELSKISEEHSSFSKEIQKGSIELERRREKCKRNEIEYEEYKRKRGQGIEKLSMEDLISVLGEEGVSQSVISTLRKNKVDSRSLIKLTESKMKESLKIKMMDRKMLISVVKKLKHGEKHVASMAEDWDPNQVKSWLSDQKIDADPIRSLHRLGVTGRILLEMNEEDLEEAGVSALGDRLNIMELIADLSIKPKETKEFSTSLYTNKPLPTVPNIQSTKEIKRIDEFLAKKGGKEEKTTGKGDCKGCRMEDTDSVLIPCGHVTCNSCVNKMKEGSNKCPLCGLDVGQIIRIKRN